MKRHAFVFMIAVFTMLHLSFPVSADENTDREYDRLLNEIPTEDMQEAIGEVFEDTNISLNDIVRELISGDKTVIEVIKETVGGKLADFDLYRRLLIKITGLALICTLFGILPQILGDGHSANTGYFISFITLIAFILSVFNEAAILVKNTIQVIIFLMNAILPAYLAALALSGAVTTAALYYEVFAVISYLAEHLILSYLCPAVLIYLALSLVNQAAETDKFSRLSDLIQKAVRFILKGILSILVGFNIFQGLITPYVDKFNTSVIRKSIEAIPGVGDIAGAGTEVAFGAAMLIKNSIGVTGLILVTAAALIPVMKISGYALVFMLVNALLQPVMQSKIQKIFETTVNAIKLLLRILLCTIIIFLISIVMLAAGSGGGL